ncbi:MAG: ABC transporter substrate-binding protein [Planctomycetota bacterium]
MSATGLRLGAHARVLLWNLCFVLLAATAGCTGDSPPPTKPDEPAAEATADEAEAVEFKLGDMLEPFDPPKLEELNATAEWVDRPVVDSLAQLLELQASEPEPPTEAEALALKNDTPGANEAIRRAMGRVRIAKNGDFYDDEAGADWDAEIIRYANGDINSTNYVLYNSATEAEVHALCGFGLFSFDAEMKPFAAAESVVSWQTSGNGLIDKVVMRDDLVWSDGEPITAHDVAWSFKLIMSSVVPIPAVRQGMKEIRWIEAYDDQTLVYFYKDSLATNIWSVNFPVIPKHIYEESVAEDPTLTRSEYHVRYEDKPVLGGPYEIADRKRGQEVILKRRESYYLHQGEQVRDRPFFKTVRLKIIPDQSVAMLALRKGDLDELQIFDPRLWVSQTISNEFYRRNTKVQAPQWLTWSFQWNTKGNPFFGDVRVRRAMGLAFDHEELHNNLRFGLDLPGIGTYHPDSPWCPDPTPQPQVQDLAAARKLLRQANWQDTDGDGVLDKDGKPFEFTVICRNEQWRIDICNLLKENLERLGVLVNVQPMEATVLIDKSVNHQFQAAFGGWSTGTDPDTSENIFATDEGRNFGQYTNAEVDRLFAEGKREFDFEKRRKIYQRIHQVLWDECCYTWLFHQNAFYAFNKELRGYNFSPRGPFSFGPGFSSMYRPAAL